MRIVGKALLWLYLTIVAVALAAALTGAAPVEQAGELIVFWGVFLGVPSAFCFANSNKRKRLD